jgi:hypothetical protein
MSAVLRITPPPLLLSGSPGIALSRIGSTTALGCVGPDLLFVLQLVFLFFR